MNLFKPKSVTYPIYRDKEIVYNVILSEKEVELQTKTKDWRLILSKPWEHGMLKYLIEQKDIELVRMLAEVLYMSLLMMHDVKLMKEFYKELERLGKRLQREADAAAKINPQSDAEILAEEKVLHEKTEESVKELEAIRNAGNAKLSTKTSPI